jgi:ketosteroid isomerase-like protein
MGEPADNLEIARRYLQALERGDTGEELSRFFAPDVVLEEFPNAPRQGARPDRSPRRSGTRQKGHVPSDL